MKPIIEVQHISKEFLIGAEKEPYLALRDILSNPFRNFKNSQVKKFKALDDVSFSVMPGESIGIIGRNGAGKSTLLKILSGITPPSSGRITCRGRIASLLEVGTGFHQELTGRENIYMNGSILGMRRHEIDKHFDAIVEFSGVSQFLDTPLKRFSSGMQLRLAFAVAAHLEPEILVIDEVLAVGDTEFQKKCLGKMDEVSKSGRTIIFVSHDLSAVTTLTKKAVFLRAGKVEMFESTGKVLNSYTSASDKDNVFTIEPDDANPSVVKVELGTSEGGVLQSSEKEMSVRFSINMPEENIENMSLSFQILNHLNQAVIYEAVDDISTGILRKKGLNMLTFVFNSLRLYRGDYFIRVHLAETKTKKKFQQFDCCMFEVEMINKKEPEWGWQTGLCQYFETGTWIKN